MSDADAAGERELAAALSGIGPLCRSIRRDLHRHPEPGWCEFRTTSVLRGALLHAGVEVPAFGRDLYRGAARMGVPDRSVLDRFAARSGVPARELSHMEGGRTGLVAAIAGGRPGLTAAFRCDIDALPIVEACGSRHLPAAEGFRSLDEGFMHACGHDGHAAIGVGVAVVLERLRPRFAGSVRIIFQPAEEGTRGAQALVDAGWLDGVSSFFALHTSAADGLRTGVVAAGVRDILATRKLAIRLRGRAAHAALAPHEGRNALVVGNALGLLFPAIQRRPGSRAMINLGRLSGGTARNVVPAEADLDVEIRADTTAEADALVERVATLVAGICDGFELEHAIETVGRSPAGVSDQQAIAWVREAARQLSTPAVEVRDVIAFGASDDVAAMLEHVRGHGGSGTYLQVGADMTTTQHTSTYDFDERVMPTAVELVVRAILRSLDS